METVGITHIGRVRDTNEDSILLECARAPYYLIVADGMGGHAAGEVASRMTCEYVKEYIDNLRETILTENKIVQAITYANKKLIELTKENPDLQGMGTTLTLAYVEEGGSVVVAQVGDSRAYYFDGERLTQITKDHTYVQHLIDMGTLKPGDDLVHPLSNIITRALGMKNLKVDTYRFEWEQDDMLLLCSDGLTAYMDREALEGALKKGGFLPALTQTLVDQALDGGGRDNISVIVAKNTPEVAMDE